MADQDLAVRSTWPDPMLALSPEEREATWGNNHLREAPGIGAFVRCLMPVRLTGGGSIEYSVWISVDPPVVHHAAEIWETPAYADLQLEGRVANSIKPWADLMGAPARAEVRDEESIPYLAADEGTLLHRVLHEEWDRDDVLARLAHALPVPVQQPVTDDWSVERSAGLAIQWHEGQMYFTGPGRTVHLYPLGPPPGVAPAEAIALMTQDAPPDRDGEAVEEADGLLRHAFWRPALGEAGIVHNLHGFTAVPGAMLHLVCVYDDPEDEGWAQGVWRSVRGRR
jgi:hypothetical protein